MATDSGPGSYNGYFFRSGCCNTIAAYFNGKHIKEGVREIGKMIENLGRMIENQTGMIENQTKMIENSSRETKEIMDRIDQRAEERHRNLIKMLS